MQRVTISLDDALLAAIDERVGSHGYQGRSEAIRDLLRAGLLEPEGRTVLRPDAGAAMVFQEPRLLPWLTAEEKKALLGVG